MIIIAIRINIARNESEQTIVEQANESNEDKKSGRENSKREGRRMKLKVVEVGRWKWKKWR